MSERVDETPFDGCPDCGGLMGYQSQADLVCRDCGGEFCHEVRGDRDLLWSYTLNYRLDEVVARVE
jgi:hypothetical protein